MKLKQGALLVLAGLLAYCAAPAHATEPPLYPLSNVEGEHVCYPNGSHLYQRGGIYFCTAAANLARWPKRVGYAILGADIARFEPAIAAAAAAAHTITGAELVRDGTPDLIIVLETELLDADQIRALAAKAGVHLSDADVHIIQVGLALTLKPGQYGSGGSVGAGWTGDATIAYFDARQAPGEDDKAVEASVGKELRKYMLSYFKVETPDQGFICSRDTSDGNAKDANVDGPDANDKGAATRGPTYLLSGAGGLDCARDHLLIRSGTETFCARPMPYWPTTVTYAAIGAQAGAHATEIAAAAAHLAQLTGRTFVAGSKPNVVIALVDRPFDDASLRAALAKANVATPPDDTAYVMTALSTALYATSTSTSTMPTLGVRTEYCDIELQQVIRTNARPPNAIRKDIDDAFLRIFEITPPRRQAQSSDSKQ